MSKFKEGDSFYYKGNNTYIVGKIRKRVGTESDYTWICDATIMKYDEHTTVRINTDQFGITKDREEDYCLTAK